MTDFAPHSGSAPTVFAIQTSHEFGEQVAAELGIALSAHEEREFEDGEHKIRPLENVRGRDVYVIHSLYADDRQGVNDKLCRLIFFLGALRDAGAAGLTAVMPYLAYARKDRKTQTRDPVTTRYVAQMIESVGVDHVVTMDVHNLAAYQNAFRCPSEHLEANRLFIEHLLPRIRDEEKIVVVSPDVGGIKRADRFRQALGHALGREPAAAFVEKARARGVLNLGRLVGDAEGATVVIVDDMIGSGSTIAHAARACREAGATRVYACASHGLFVGKANEHLADEALYQIIVTDSVPPFRLDPVLAQQRLVVLPSAKLFAEAIRRMHEGGSLVELLAT
ncbi:MAG: ribose-phosphate pyrophosphokinase [Acidiferrobacteraceae bacterium]|jgi:ribose-phosphate pyrophosphokinase